MDFPDPLRDMSSTQKIRSTHPKVAVFDSGLGGLTIYDAIRRHFPWVELCYCSDNAAFPYGSKSEDELVDRVSKVLMALHHEADPDILVIACNTASTVALPRIRSLLQEPVIGVVPAIKPAAAVAGGSHIALLATPGTVQRRYTRDLIDQYGRGFEWVCVGSSELVLLAEQKMYGQAPSLEAIAGSVSDLKNYTADTLDTVVLGCTHFPLLKSELQQTLPNIRHWIDSSDAIASRCGFWLHELGFQQQNHSAAAENTLFFTARLGNEAALSRLITGRSFQPARYLKA